MGLVAMVGVGVVFGCVFGEFGFGGCGGGGS